MTQNIEREFGWDDTIQNDGGSEFVLLPEGDYNFTVKKFERARFAGSEKMPACNQAKLEITVHSPEHGDVVVFHNLFLHSKTEGLLSNFFAGIGQKKKGEPLRMNWNTVIGAKGKLKLGLRNYKSKGEDRTANEIKRFYSYEEVYGAGAPAQPQGYQQPSYQQQPQQQGYQQPQQGYQQPAQNQAPFPNQPQQGGGWQQGTF